MMEIDNHALSLSIYSDKNAEIKNFQFQLKTDPNYFNAVEHVDI